MTTLVLGTESFSDIPDVNGQLVMLNGGSTGTITTGTFASRPAASTAGNLYVDSTNFVWYYDNGTTWTILGAGANPVFSGTTSMTIPVGTTAQRPGSPTTGMLRYNTTLGSFEGYDTTIWESFSGVIDKSTVQVVQTGTTSANFISFSVPGNTLGTTGILKASLTGLWSNAAGGGNKTLTITVSYGGSTLWSSTSGNLTNGVSIAFEMDFYLAANNSATSQTLSGTVLLGAGTANAGTGTGTLTSVTTAPFAVVPVSGTSAITSSSAQTFQIAIVQAGAGTAGTMTKYFHIIESF